MTAGGSRIARRFTTLASAFVVIAASAVAIVAAATADGYDRTELDLQDEGVWVIRHDLREIAYLSKASGRLEVKLGTAQLTEARLSQFAADAVVAEDPLGRAQALDTRTGSIVSVLEEAPDNAQLVHRGPTVALINPRTGAIRVGPVASLGGLGSTEGEPTFSVGSSVRVPAVIGVGNDGQVHAASPIDGLVVTFDPETLELVERELEPFDAAGLQVSAAGSTPLVFDADADVLHVPGLEPVPIDRGDGSTPALQQPSDDSARALVATDTDLLSVDLQTGEVTKLGDGGTGDPAPPVNESGFAFAAWSSAASAYRVDPDGQTVVYDDSNEDGQRLAWQVGRNIVALNNITTGEIAFADDLDEVQRLGDAEWLRALDRTDADDEELGQGDGEGSSTVQQPEDLIEEQVPPEPQDDDQFGTREGRAVIIPVLANDRDANGDLLTVVEVRDVLGGTAGVVGGGTAVQFTPNGEARNGSFTYLVSDGFFQVPARVTVPIYPLDGANNQPPRRLESATGSALRVGLNSPFETNLLRGWYDPEGDSFAIAAPPTFVPEEAAGWFTVEANGRLSGQAFAITDIEIEFEVIDEFGGIEGGSFTIEVDEDLSVEAFPDAAIGRVGETVVIDVLANDLGSDLRVGKVTPVTPGVTAQPVGGGRRVAARADAPGEYTFEYEVRPSGAIDQPAVGTVRLTVPDPAAENRPPSPAPDFVLTKPGIPIVVDVLDNDSDPDADVLVVTDAISSVPGAAEVQVIDNQFVRILVDDFPLDGRPVEIRYVVSDGLATAESTVQVMRDTFAGDRPPVLRDDYVTVRAGTIRTIDVLANDSDPDSVLRLASTDPVRPGVLPEGAEFIVNGDQIVFIAPPEAGIATATYRVEGGLTSANIVVTITSPPDGTNENNATLERMPDVTVRALQGQEVRIPLPLDADPDGDELVLIGNIAQGSGALGTVVPINDDMVRGGYLVYRAESTKQGLDSFTYQVEEQYGDNRLITGTVWVGVARPQSVRVAPVANDDIVFVEPGETRQIDVLRNDTPPGEVTLERVDPIRPEFGVVELDDPDDPRYVVYTAPSDVSSAEYRLRYQVGLNGLKSTGTINVIVTTDRPNLPPVVVNGTVRLTNGATGEFDVLSRAYDPDGEASELQLALDDPASTSARVAGGSIVLDDATATEVVFFVVTDGGGASTKGFVRFVVENRAPISTWTQIEVDGDQPVTVDVAEFVEDPDGDEWTMLGADNAVNGSISSVDGTEVVFIPNADTENASFSVDVKDALEKSATLTFDFSVRTNRPPDPLSVNLGVPSKGAARTVTIDPNDPDRADVGTHEIVGGCQAPAGISVTQSGRLDLTISTELLKGASGTVTCTIRDSRNLEGTARINVLVEGTDRARPSANPLSFTMKLGEQGGGAESQTIPLSDPLDEGVRVELLGADSSPVGASVSGDGRTMTLTVNPPQSGFSGQTSFTYRVIDAEDRTAEANVTVIVEGVPKPPVAPQAQAGNRTITLTWSPPPPNGVPVDYYNVARDGGSPQRLTGNSTSFSELNNGTPYTFTIQACHDLWGCSDPVSSAPVIPDSPPGPALNLGSVRGDQKVSLSWQAGDPGGSPIQDYVIQCDACGGAPVVLPAGSTTHEWTGLSNGTTYTFTVTVRKELQSTSEIVTSPPVTTSAVPAGLPFAPAVATPGQRDDGALTVTWGEAPANGDPISGYQVRVDGAAGNCEVSVATRSATCTGIPSGSTVRIGVRGVNAVGTGEEGLSDQQVAARKPATPSITGLQGNGSTAAVQISVADLGGVAAQDMEVRRSGASIGVRGYATTFNVDTPVGGTYTFAVRVRNTSGFWSDWSSETRAVKGQGVPQIVSFAGSTGNNTLTWSWNASANHADNVQVVIDGTAVALSGANELAVTQECGTNRTRSMTVNYVWDGVPLNAVGPATATATAAACPPPPPPPPPPPAVSIAIGAQTTGGLCSDNQGCYFVNVSMSNFTSGSNTVRCYGRVAGGWTQYDSFAAGNGTHVGRCAYSFAGRAVVVAVNGTISGSDCCPTVSSGGVQSNIIVPWPTD